jgi:hypothetical protein
MPQNRVKVKHEIENKLDFLRLSATLCYLPFFKSGQKAGVGIDLPLR